MTLKTSRMIRVIAAVLVGTLSACGGGSGSDQCRSINPNQTSCSTTAAGTTNVNGPLKLSLLDAKGATITSVSAQRAGVVQALLTDASGRPLPGVAVVFSTNDKTATLVPASGTALTDSAGIARIGLAAGTQAGGFTVTASSAAAGDTNAKATIDYAVSFPTLALGALAITPSPLAAGGTASLVVTVLEGAQPFAPAQLVSFSSPCAATGKAIISSPVTTVAGVASTSYTDKGCGAADTITATTSLGGVTVTQSGSITVLGAIAGQLAFVSALPQNISMKGTGGPGRQESSTITFKVLDRNGNPVAGAPVTFGLFGAAAGAAGTGGLTLNPASATSGADGTVTTTVFAGIVNTPVRVTATINGTSPAVTSTSDQLVISTGIPDQKSFSLSTATYNVEGANFDGCASNVGSTVSVFLADHFNNPVPDGTAVSFTAEGGAIDASCLTGLANTQLTNGSVISQKGIPGSCSVRFCSANPRASDGRVTILAYALGEESFDDNPAIPNGINRYDAGETFTDLCEPVRYHWPITDAEANRALRATRPLSDPPPPCIAPAVRETYIDSNGDGRYNANGDNQYNGVLNVDPATGQTVASNRSPTVHVRAALVQVMSGSAAAIDEMDGNSVFALSHCTDGAAFVNTAKTFRFAVRDKNLTTFPGNILPGNILPAGTRIEFTTSNGTILGKQNFVVPNTNAPGSENWTYTAQLQSDASQLPISLACSNTVSNGALTITVTTPQGVITTKSFPVTD